MKDQEKNSPPEQPQDNPRNPKEDIPLWLQGLEEETKANRIQAAKEKLPESEEEPQVPMSTDASPESGDETETHSEGIENEQAGFVLIEEFPQDSSDFESLPEPPETPEPVSEEVDDLEDLLKPDDAPPQDSSTADTIKDSVEPLETLPPDMLEKAEDSQSPMEDLSGNLSPIDPGLNRPDSLEASIGEPETEQGSDEVGETEKVSTLTPDSLIDEDENLEWVNEITELETETSDFPEGRTKPQNILEFDQRHIDNKLEDAVSEPSSPSEEEPFLDISELNVDANQEDHSSTDEAQEAPTSRIFDIIQESESSTFIEDKILSDNEEPTFLEGGISPTEEGLAFDEEENLPDDEELPKWLQRLISESYPEENSGQLMPLDNETLNEITKPVLIPSPLSLPDDPEEMEKLEFLEELEGLEDFEEVEEFEDSAPAESVSETDFAAEPGTIAEELELSNEDTNVEFDLDNLGVDELSSPADEASPSKEVDIDFLIDEDTQPVRIIEETLEELPVVIEEPIEWTEEDNLYFNSENGYLIEIPEPLQFARQVLKHGDITQGLDILNTYISDDSFLDEIKIWLLEAAESRMESQSEIWESIGDIAASQDRHQEALAAYSKAINYLLSTKEENGTG